MLVWTLSDIPRLRTVKHRFLTNNWIWTAFHCLCTGCIGRTESEWMNGWWCTDVLMTDRWCADDWFLVLRNGRGGEYRFWKKYENVTLYQDPYAKRFMKDEKITKTAYIANSGGLLGLCMGFRSPTSKTLKYERDHGTKLWKCQKCSKFWFVPLQPCFCCWDSLPLSLWFV